MRHLRMDYDAIQPWPTRRPHYGRLNGSAGAIPGEQEKNAEPLIPDDEPVFVLRGQDPSAEIAVRAWADDVERHHGDAELVRRVREWATEMGEYARAHGGTVADVPEGALRA